MSLTSILNYNDKDFKDFRDLLSSSFIAPKFKIDERIKAEPRTTNYMLVGKAFDYLLRFNLERRYKVMVHSRQWVSESALRYFKDSDNRSLLLGKSRDEYLIKLVDDMWVRKKEKNKKVLEKFNECKRIYATRNV